jgi:hypothetical protein
MTLLYYILRYYTTYYANIPHFPFKFRSQVGVLGSNVHSIVMSSNNMVGQLPDSIANLQVRFCFQLLSLSAAKKDAATVP